MNPGNTILLLSALAGGVALVAALASGRRVSRATVAAIERHVRWIRWASLGLACCLTGPLLYPAGSVFPIAVAIGVVAAVSRLDQFALWLGAFLWLWVISLNLGLQYSGSVVYSLLSPVAICLSVLALRSARRRSYDRVVAIYLVLLIGAEWVLASGASGGFWSREPFVCSVLGGQRAVPVLQAIVQRHWGDPRLVAEGLRELKVLGAPPFEGER